jgi:hypothetical protein
MTIYGLQNIQQTTVRMTENTVNVAARCNVVIKRIMIFSSLSKSDKMSKNISAYPFVPFLKSTPLYHGYIIMCWAFGKHLYIKKMLFMTDLLFPV